METVRELLARCPDLRYPLYEAYLEFAPSKTLLKLFQISPLKTISRVLFRNVAFVNYEDKSKYNWVFYNKATNRKFRFKIDGMYSEAKFAYDDLPDVNWTCIHILWLDGLPAKYADITQYTKKLFYRDFYLCGNKAGPSVQSYRNLTWMKSYLPNGLLCVAKEGPYTGELTEEHTGSSKLEYFHIAKRVGYPIDLTAYEEFEAQETLEITNIRMRMVNWTNRDSANIKRLILNWDHEFIGVGPLSEFHHFVCLEELTLNFTSKVGTSEVFKTSNPVPSLKKITINTMKEILNLLDFAPNLDTFVYRGSKLPLINGCISSKLRVIDIVTSGAKPSSDVNIRSVDSYISGAHDLSILVLQNKHALSLWKRFTRSIAGKHETLYLENPVLVNM